MQVSSKLKGQTILILEDEPLVSLDVSEILIGVGARVERVETVRHALDRVDNGTIDAAVVDHRLRGEDSTDVCTRLMMRGIPFVVYSGATVLPESCRHAPFLTKPADPKRLIAALESVT
jgi:CheY-like chemotaxis protein